MHSFVLGTIVNILIYLGGDDFLSLPSPPVHMRVTLLYRTAPPGPKRGGA